MKGGKYNGGGGRSFRDSTVFVDGKPIGQELEEERFYAEQYAAASRYETILHRHDKATGTINEKYLDYQQTMKVNALIHALNQRGYTFGEYMDLLMDQALRPEVGFNALSVLDYSLRSAFIDVSASGRSDGLFNNLVAEGISVLSEFLTDCIADRKIEGTPEEVIRRGFESIGKSTRGGEIPLEVAKGMDQMFDDIQIAVEKKIELQEGKFKGVKAGAGSYYDEIGKYLAREVKKLSPAEQMKLANSAGAYKFCQRKLKHIGLNIIEPPEVEQANIIAALEAKLAKTEAGVSLAEKEKPLKNARQASKSDNLSLAT